MKTVFLGIIAACLISIIWVTYVYPEYLLKSKKPLYKELFLKCSLAKYEKAALSGKHPDLDKAAIERLKKTLTIQNLSCVELDILKNILVSNGVEYSEIRAMELSELSKNGKSIREFDFL